MRRWTSLPTFSCGRTRGWWRIALVALFILLGLYFHDLYDHYRIPSRTVLLQQFCFVLGIAFLLQALLSYGRWDIIVPRRIMLYGSLLFLAVGPLWRIVFTRAVRTATGAQKLLFLGASPAVREIIQSLQERPELGMAPIGFWTSKTAWNHLTVCRAWARWTA